jgi:hypothetical protein
MTEEEIDGIQEPPHTETAPCGIAGEDPYRTRLFSGKRPRHFQSPKADKDEEDNGF